MKKISYARHRFPPDIIQYAVWLYFRFLLSSRDVEDLLPSTPDALYARGRACFAPISDIGRSCK